MNYLSRFEKLVQELISNPKIDLIDRVIRDPASAEDITAVEQEIGTNLPLDVRNFFCEMNGFLLEWTPNIPEVQSPKQSNLGSVEILPISDVFKSGEGITWFDYKDGDKFKLVKPLDFFEPEACSSFLFTPENGLSPTIYYHYIGETLYDTGYNFSDYIDRLLAARGFFYWIESICLESYKSAQSQQFFSMMPALFEDFDQSLFVPGVTS